MSHQKGRLKNSKFWLCLSLILCLVSAIVASAVQTSGGIRIKEMSWESPSGHQLAAYLYIPQNATKDTPAPGVVTIEGWYNNKEMQDLYSIELARRGYVVLALDLHSHGDSESLSIAELYDGAVGVDGAVQLIASLPYVDTARIGVTGHSSGGTAANMAVEIDNSRETPLIAAVLQQAGDWQDDTGGDHSGDYGSRSVGIIASTHDDFYFGTYDDAGNMLTNPAAFMETDGAKKFLNFNEDGFAGIAEGGKYYTRDFDGKTAYRVIYRPNMIHPLVAFSTTCVGYAVDFFDTTLGAPKPLPASDQIWPIKAVFNSLGVIGLLIFMVSFTLVLLDTPVFSALRSGEIVQPAPVQDSGAKAWYWVLLIIGAVFSGSSFLFCMNTVYSKTTNFFVQTGPLTIGTWAALCGVFAIFCSAVFYGAYGKKHGWSARRAGLYLNLEQLWKTIALAVIVIVVSFGLVFAAHYFFQVDGNGDGEHRRHAEQHRPHQRSNEAHGKAPWATQHKAAQQNGKVHRAQHVAHLRHMAGDHGQHKGQCKEQCSQHEAAGGGMGVRFHKKLPPLARQKRGLPGLQANGRPLRGVYSSKNKMAERKGPLWALRCTAA